jgi:hypothetical protein
MACSDGGVTGGFRPVIAAFVVIVIASVEQIWGLPMLAPSIEVGGTSRLTNPAAGGPTLTVVELWGVSPNGDTDFGQAAAAVTASMGHANPPASPFLRTVRRSVRTVRMMGMPVLEIVTW